MRKLGLSIRRVRRAGAFALVLSLAVAGLQLTVVPVGAACGIDAALDVDGDCVAEVTEETIGTDAWDPDTDDDLLADGYEHARGSNPTQPNSTADRFVRALLTDLGITVTEARIDLHEPGATTTEGRSKLVRQLAYSDTYVRGVVDRFYRDTLDRPGDPGGTQYWTDLLTSKQLTTAEAAGYFYASEEYYDAVGRNLDAWLVDLYDALLLRDPDPTGYAYWKNVARTRGRAAVSLPFYQSIETRELRVRHLYRRFLARTPDPAGQAHWADVLLRTGDDVDLAVNLATSTEYWTRSTKRRWGTFGPPPPPVRVRRIDAADGPAAGHGSDMPSISDDGRHVAYRQGFDLYLWDRHTNENVLIPVGYDGTPSDGLSWFPVVSGDGSHVAFLSEASNLVPDDTNRDIAPDHFYDFDVFVWNRLTRQTERVSVSSDEMQADAPSDFSLDISRDGRYVVFSSYATNLDEPTTEHPKGFEFADLFIRDRLAGTTEQLTHSAEDSITHSLHSTVSDDGRYVAFSSMADDLVLDDGNDHIDVFMVDRSTGETTRISADTHPGSSGDSDFPRISGDGRYVVFNSFASNLVADDTEDLEDVFRWDRTTGAMIRIPARWSEHGDGGGAAGRYASVSSDGRFVAFGAPVLDSAAYAHVVQLWDAETGSVSLVSARRDGQLSYGTETLLWAISGDGGFVVFDSDAADLVPDDDNGHPDIFLWERAPG